MPSTPKEFRLWEDHKNWLDKKAATSFLSVRVLDTIPSTAKICIIPGGENADCVMYNDFRGGIHVLITDLDGSRWLRYRDEDTAFQEFLQQDIWA